MRLRTALTIALALAAAAVLPPTPRARADAQQWRDKFGKADPDEVYKSIEQAAEQKSKEAAMPLLEAGLAARYPHIAVACGEALTTLGDWPTGSQPDVAAVDKLIDKALKAKDEGDLRNLARVLGAWGHPMVDEPMSHLASGRRTPAVQVEALIMAGGLRPREGALFPETHQVIEKAIDGRSPEIRLAACSAAGRWKDKKFTESLVSLVRSDKEDYPGLYAVWALKQIGATPPVDTFIHVLESNPKKTTKQACLKAITELATPKDVESLLGFSRSGKTDNRDAAILALGRIAWRGGFQAKTTGSDAPKSVIPPAVIDRFLQVIAEDSDYEVRDAARLGMLRIGEAGKEKAKAALPALVDFGGNDDARQTAMELCGLLGLKDEGGTIFKSLYKPAVFDRSRTIRMFAARALEGVDAKKAVEDLARAAEVNQKGGATEQNAVRALGYIRTRESYDALQKMIDGDGKGWSEPMLREAEFALERLTGHRFGRKPERWAMWIEKAERPFHLRAAHFDRVQNRKDAVKKGLYGITPDTEKMVENGLRFLELYQHPTGEWDGNERGFGGVVTCQPAYTGLSLLALLGAGYNAKQGKYKETIRRGSEFLAATQFYDGGFPVTGGGDDSWIFAYLVAMGVWGINETYALSGDAIYREPSQWGVDYLCRVQTPGAGWRYGPRYVQSDTSCTSWTLMTLKAADVVGLDVPQRAFDGIDSWLERCSYDMTGEEEVPDDLSTDYDHEVGSRRYFKAFTGYLELSGGEKSALQQTSMTAVGMVCRFFMGWKRSHPYMIGCANFLMDALPQWMKGLERGQAVAWYHYYWYYGTIAMHQMGGRFWRAWNSKVQALYRANQRASPPELVGSWDPDTAVLNGGRLFSTPMSILSLETYYRFSPLLTVEVEKGVAAPPQAGDKPGDKPDGGKK